MEKLAIVTKQQKKNYQKLNEKFKTLALCMKLYF